MYARRHCLSLSKRFGEIGAWKLDEIGWMQPQKVMASVDELIGMFLPSAFLGG